MVLFSRRRRFDKWGVATFVAMGIVVTAGGSAARAQVTIGTQRKYSYPDNRAIVSIGNTYDGTGSSGQRDVYIGAQTTTVISGGEGQLPASFDAYCVQLGTSLLHPTQTVTVGPMDSTFSYGKASVNPGVDYGGALAWLYDQYSPVAADQSQVSAQQSAALQLSLWEVEYNWDGTALNGIDPTLQAGNFQYLGNPTQTSPTIQYDPAITQAIRDDAAAMLKTWNGQTNDTSSSLLNGHTSGGQSLVGPRVVRSVPEPASLAFALGPILLGLAGWRHRGTLTRKA